MSIYANIKFNMKDGHKAPELYDSQCGEFRDVALEIVNIYDATHDNKKRSQSINLTGEELAIFGHVHAEEAKFESINFLVKDEKHDWSNLKKIQVCDYYKNGEFTIEDKDITGYYCDRSQAFMPVYNLHKTWARQDILDGDTDIENNLPIFKRYVQLTLEGKMFFGVQISKIESVTLELC